MMQTLIPLTKAHSYDSISTSARRALVSLVFEQNVSVRQSSKILGIKYTTGKALIQKYRKNGNIDRIRGRRGNRDDKERQETRTKLIGNLPI